MEVTALWPPAGVGMALLILYWPGIVLGDLAVADFSQPAGTVLGQTVGNTLEVLIAAILFCRLSEGTYTVRAGPRRRRTGRGSRRRNGRQRCVRGSVAASSGGVIASRRVGTAWRTGFLGRSFRAGRRVATHGQHCRRAPRALVRAPLLLCWVGVRIDAMSPRRAFEGAALATLIVVLALLPSLRDVPYIIFPVLIWAPLRGGPRGAAGAVALATAPTVYNTAHHAGPFVQATITQSLLATQLFVAAAAMTSLVLGGVMEQRHVALEALRENERRLRDSRARVVKAGDAARRRLERNLHDGARQRLVSLALTLRLAKLQLHTSPAETEHLLSEPSQELPERHRRAQRTRPRHPPRGTDGPRAGARPRGACGPLTSTG